MPKLLKEVYTTYEGARKRAAFENGVAKGEFERGGKAKHYHYSIMSFENYYKVAREPHEDVS